MATEPPGNDKLFRELDVYPWDRDISFQNALAAFLGPNSSPSQTLDLTLRAQCYYYARKKNLATIDYDAYRAHVLLQRNSGLPESKSATHSSSEAVPAGEQAALDATVSASAPSDTPLQVNKICNPSNAKSLYPASFAHIVELIVSGAPIPGIREIPPTVLPDQATKPLARMRLKPWEKELVEGESTFGNQRGEVITQEITGEFDVTDEGIYGQGVGHVGIG